MIEPKQGKWLAKPGKRRLRFYDIGWIWLFTYVAMAFDHFLHWAIFEYVGMALVASMLLLAVVLPVRDLLARRRSARDRAFSDGAAAEFAVEVILETGGKTVGADRGLIWFDQGQIGFTGERTSFLLAYSDFYWPSGWTVLTDADLPYGPLRFRIGETESKITVRPMLGQGRRYRRAVKQFYLEKAAPTAERQWPPVTREFGALESGA